MQRKEMRSAARIQREGLPRNAVVRNLIRRLGVFPRAYRLHPCYPGTLVFAQSNTTSSRRSLMPMQCRNTPRAILERQGCLCFLPHTRGLFAFTCIPVQLLFQRCARTDKGVSAARQLVSLKIRTLFACSLCFFYL